jgi:hypothetical protein
MKRTQRRTAEPRNVDPRRRYDLWPLYPEDAPDGLAICRADDKADCLPEAPGIDHFGMADVRAHYRCLDTGPVHRPKPNAESYATAITPTPTSPDEITPTAAPEKVDRGSKLKDKGRPWEGWTTDEALYAHYEAFDADRLICELEPLAWEWAQQIIYKSRPERKSDLEFRDHVAGAGRIALILAARQCIYKSMRDGAGVGFYIRKYMRWEMRKAVWGEPGRIAVPADTLRSRRDKGENERAESDQRPVDMPPLPDGKKWTGHNPWEPKREEEIKVDECHREFLRNDNPKIRPLGAHYDEPRPQWVGMLADVIGEEKPKMRPIAESILAGANVLRAARCAKVARETARDGLRRLGTDATRDRAEILAERRADARRRELEAELVEARQAGRVPAGMCLLFHKCGKPVRFTNTELCEDDWANRQPPSEHVPQWVRQRTKFKPGRD